MTTLNAYATLSELHAYVTARSGNAMPSDPTDDAILETFLKSASEHIENETDRRFVPFIQTRYFDVPGLDTTDPRALQMDDDLLEVLSITNGDGVTIPSTEYALRPRNSSPYLYIRLIDNSTFYWASDGAGDTHDVIAVTGIWGYHNRYSSAWVLGSTAAEAMDSSETDYSVTSGLAFEAGQLIRFDNEFGYVSSKAADVLTITRGENGSTATTHLTSINIYIWQPMNAAKTAVLEITHQSDANRTGQSVSNTATVTAGGVVLQPRDIPAKAQMFINTHRRYT